MQDFQEVIEDSQLINAMYDDTPKPTEAWFSASQEELDVYHSHLNNYNPTELSIPYICNTSLGFYLVSISELNYILALNFLSVSHKLL